MAKSTAPFLSLSAHGTTADGITYRKSPGGTAAYPLASPPTSDTPAQHSRRLLFGCLTKCWPHMDAADRLTWAAPAARLALPPKNLFIGENLARWSRHLYPTATYRPSPTSTPATWGFLTGWANTSRIGLVAAATNPPNPFLMLAYLNQSATPPPASSDLVAVVWTPNVARFTALLPFLPPGVYYAHARVINADGVPGEWKTSVALTVT